MPGPGPHMMYAMGTGLAMMNLSNGRFSPHHVFTYTINAFFGPDMGSFSEWVGSFFYDSFGSSLADAIHHPFYYFILLGFPLCLLYAWISRVLLLKGLLDSVSGVPLTRWQCFLLICAGSFSHFFLDHLFEENGHSSMYIWILSTGWWKGRAPINPDAVVVVGALCICLIGGFIYINRVRPAKSVRDQSYESVRDLSCQSARLVFCIASLYGLWCFSQIWWANPRRAAVGEEADLGVLVFLAIYLFLPHLLCIMSMNGRDLDMEALPLITV